jgi:hypothetical protein
MLSSGMSFTAETMKLPSGIWRHVALVPWSWNCKKLSSPSAVRYILAACSEDSQPRYPEDGGVRSTKCRFFLLEPHEVSYPSRQHPPATVVVGELFSWLVRQLVENCCRWSAGTVLDSFGTHKKRNIHCWKPEDWWIHSRLRRLKCMLWLTVCCITDNVGIILICSYQLWVFNKPNYQSTLCLQSLLKCDNIYYTVYEKAHILEII